MSCSAAVALRKESVDRNFYYADKDCDWVRSLSARRAWIEITRRMPLIRFSPVALRKESVDRNTNPGSTTLTFPVALRKESVDRNKLNLINEKENTRSLSARRAWIEIKGISCKPAETGSLSARRAWIEIILSR